MNKLTYQDCKDLQEAGFPQGDGMYIQPDGGALSKNLIADFTHLSYLPSLEELIEACGEDFHCLIHTTNGGMDNDKEFWSAGTSSLVNEWVIGSSPIQAVKNLYIALHKK